MNSNQNDLLHNLDKIHTTELGIQRITRNLNAGPADVVEWCKKQISDPSCKISRNGKNWYAAVGDMVFTVNAHSYTIITAHRDTAVQYASKKK